MATLFNFSLVLYLKSEDKKIYKQKKEKKNLNKLIINSGEHQYYALCLDAYLLPNEYYEMTL